MVRQFQAQGLSPEDARKKAIGVLALQVGEAGASGALMGVGFGVAANISANSKTSKQARAVNRFLNQLEKQVKTETKTGKVIAPGKVNFTGGLTESSMPTDVLSQVQRIARATGRTINIYSGPSWQNGKYNEDTGEINVNINSGDPVAQVISHELTHSIEKAGAYGKLSKIVLKRIKAEGGNLAALRKAKNELYAKNGIELKDDTEVDKEIVAEYVAKHLLTNEQSILSLTQESPSLGRRILNWLDSLIAKLGNKVSQERTFLLNARNLYAKALFQTQGSFNAETDTDTTAATEAPAAADTIVQTNKTHHSEENSAAADMSYDDMRQRAREMYEQGEISEVKYDEVMELADQLEEESAGSEEQYSLNETPYNVTDGIVDLSNHNELSKRLDGLTGAQKYKEIQSYILETLGDQPITMKDGRAVVVDRSDALHIAHNAANKKTAQISEIRSIVENADLYAEETDVDHKKFDYFCYYKNMVRHDGKVYPVYLNVGRAINDKTYHLYDITNRIRATADRINGLERPKSNEGYALTSDDSTISIRNRQRNVNEKFSISDQVSKQDVVSDLREILRRGGDPAELRRYVENMERGTERTAEVESADSQDAEVQEILRAAREQNISVDEYLRRNWEQYEYDGQLNPAARTALDMEKGDVQYSVSEDQTDEESKTTGEELSEDPRGNLPRKAQEFLKRAENKLLNDLGEKLSVPKFARREYLRPIVQEISNEYLRTGTVSDEKIAELFQKAYAEGVVVDAEFYDQYKDLKKYLRTNAVTISEQDKADIADYADFKQRARYTLRIVDKGGLPVDVAYDELHGMAQELFPDSITHPADQLMRMYEVARSIQVTERSLQDYYGQDEQEFRKWAQNDFAVSVGEIMGDLREVKRYWQRSDCKEI